MFLLFIIIFILIIILGLFGYKYYQENYNIEVPNLIGMSYIEAEVVLAKKDLNVTKKEIKIKDEEKDQLIMNIEN